MNIKAYIGGLIFLLAFTACKQSKKQEQGRSIITVTIEPLRYFTEAIAGNLFQVETIVPKGSSPETYDPTPQQMVKLNDSRAYIEMGKLGFELQWIPKIKSNLPELPIFDASNGIDYIHTDNHTCNHHEGEDFSADPHVWMSTQNAAIIARNICEALIKLAPGHHKELNERCEKLLQQIEKTNQEIRQLLTTNKVDKAFLIYHPTLTYYAHEYGFQQIPIEKYGKVPTPAYLKQLLDKCKELEIKTIFIQPEFDQRNAELIANQTHTNIVRINPLAYAWNKEMIGITKSLIEQ